MRLPLIPHPTSPHGGLTLEVEARRAGRVLSLDYVLAGPVERVRWPQAAARARTDGLWQATCFEAFVRTTDGYLEYNLSPSGAWAAYRFDGYREGKRGLEIAAPFIVTRMAPGRFVLTVDVELPEDATDDVGLTAVIEGLDGSIAYWALAHPSMGPDFHHPDTFAAVL
ncbi:DOMON-like domain-containing protein [Brevundimonas intermedia]|uniref:DOMON-like domain-containing protein n=1 Tax=Brevundimonas intermedia TaxID=74315 RepID=UPI0032080B2D